MKIIQPIILVISILVVGCATTERDIQIQVRDAETKKEIDENGRLVLNRLSFFSSGTVGHGADLDSKGIAFFDSVEKGSWSLQADIEGYDLARSGFSFGGKEEKTEWNELRNMRLNPNFPNRKLEFQLVTTEPNQSR